MERAPTCLFLIPTPIGNLGDITLRAIETLKQVDLVLAEDTRTSGILLRHLGISKPMQAFHIHNEHQQTTRLIERMKQGEIMGLVSDAGTPGISDPGFLLVREALHHQLPVECLPGPTAFVPALVKSGLPCDRFVFEGFLPHKKGRQTLLKELSLETRTIVFYESPHRLIKTLEQLQTHFGPERPASVSRELTKHFEETVNGTLHELLLHFSAREPKGEFVLVVGGYNSEKTVTTHPHAEDESPDE